MVLAGLHPEAGVARLALSPGRQSTQQAGLFAAVSGQGASTAKEEKKEEKKESNGTLVAPTAMATSTATAAAVAPTTTDGGSSPAVESQHVAANGEPKEFNTMAGSKLAPTTSVPAIHEPTTTTSPSDPEHIRNKSSESHLPETSRAGTYTVPYHDKQVSSPPADARQGTSETRFEQQGGTHAEGQLEHGTPNTTVDGQGTSHTVVEPRTVGQAPKETPLFDEEVEQKPGMMEQAQQIAGQAVEQVQALPGVVMGAVGLGGAKEEEKVEEPEEAKKEDSRVDELDDKVVEEFVRDLNMTKQQNK